MLRPGICCQVLSLIRNFHQRFKGQLKFHYESIVNIDFGLCVQALSERQGSLYFIRLYLG